MKVNLKFFRIHIVRHRSAIYASTQLYGYMGQNAILIRVHTMRRMKLFLKLMIVLVMANNVYGVGACLYIVPKSWTNVIEITCRLILAAAIKVQYLGLPPMHR